jgi:hypothetical protein
MSAEVIVTSQDPHLALLDLKAFFLIVLSHTSLTRRVAVCQLLLRHTLMPVPQKLRDHAFTEPVDQAPSARGGCHIRRGRSGPYQS